MYELEECLTWYRQTVDRGARQVTNGKVTAFLNAKGFGFINDAVFFHANNLHLPIFHKSGKITLRPPVPSERDMACLVGTEVIYQKAISTRGEKAYQWCTVHDVILAMYMQKNFPTVTLYKEDGPRPIGNLSRGDVIKKSMVVTDLEHLCEVLGDEGVNKPTMLRIAKISETGQVLATKGDVDAFWSTFTEKCKQAVRGDKQN